MDGPEPPPQDVGMPMQRVRIGMIGLAGVFLLVILAASLFGFLGKAPPSQEAGTVIANALGNDAEAPKEPLAELGVAPGNAPSTGNETAPLAPTPRPVPRAR